MVLLYMVAWIPSIYPLYVSIYTSTSRILWDDTVEYRNQDLSMDAIAKSEIIMEIPNFHGLNPNGKHQFYVCLFHVFVFFPEKQNRYMFRRKNTRPKEDMSRGMAVEQAWNDLQMPWKCQKKTKNLNKAWKGFPPKKYILWLCWIWNHETKQFSYA